MVAAAQATDDAAEALPLDGGGLGGGELSARSAPVAESTPPQPLPIKGRGLDIWTVLSGVPDPEIPAVSIVDLGIVREATAERVVITPTYTGCPATLVIQTDIRIALDKAGFGDVRIETVLSPPWTTDWIGEEGKRKLLAYGIAPPRPAGVREAACPQCGSTDTEEISRFGSTPCKAQWRCRSCLEPFDLFKCH
jgi:ring-1,2-phenylacetyl-CoA epoxidase subunit PaaD